MFEDHTLSLRLLGTLEVMRAGERIELPRSRKTRALLAYLVITQRPHRRQRLCDLLWEIPNDPRAALRWSLSKLRPLVNDAKIERIKADRQTVSFDASDARIDWLVVDTGI